MRLVVLITINLPTKSEMSSFICCKDTTGFSKCRMGHVTLTTPTCETVSNRRLTVHIRAGKNIGFTEFFKGFLMLHFVMCF